MTYQGSTTTTSLIPQGATWKYLDNGTNQGTAWYSTAFNDTSWKSGPAQLGYGDGDEATTVGYGSDPNNKYITTYFRKTFTVTNPSQFNGLTLDLLRDDGAVIYVNGQEVARSNMPTGTIDYQTLAATAIGGDDETTTFYSLHAESQHSRVGNQHDRRRDSSSCGKQQRYQLRSAIERDEHHDSHAHHDHRHARSSRSAR